MAKQDTKVMTMGEVTRQLGISDTTVRYHEKAGHIKPERISFAGGASMRVFRETDVAALRAHLQNHAK